MTSDSAELDMAALRRLDAQLYDLLIEACHKRPALAAVLLRGIATIAADMALNHERARVQAHLQVADAIGPSGLPVAIEAIRNGARIGETEERYRAAADTRRTTKLALVATPAREGA